MATYYVHQKTGDDTNDGLTIGASFQTVDKALTTYTNGDIVKIKGGYTYTVSSTPLTKNLTMQAWDDDRPGYEPILTWTGANHMLRIADASATNQIYYFYNITFYRSAAANYSAIYWNPANASDADLVVYGCNFMSDWDPVGGDWATEGIYGIYVSSAASTNGLDNIDIDYCSFVKLAAGVYGWFYDKAFANIDRSIFYMCGDSDDPTKAAITAARRNTGSGTQLVLTMTNNIFSGCGYTQYDVDTTSTPTIISSSFVEALAEVGTAYPFRDLDVFDFRQPNLSYIATFDYGVLGTNSTKKLAGTEYTLTMITSFVKPFASRIVNSLNWFSTLSYGKYDAFDIKAAYDDAFFIYWDSVPSHITINDTTDKDTWAYLTGNVGDGAIIEAVMVSHGDIPGWFNIQGTKLDDYSSGGNRKAMTSAKHDIIIEQGANFKRSLIWKDENADPVDLTGYSAVMSIRGKKSDAAALLTIKDTGGSPEIVLGGAAGTIDIDILATNTGSLDFVWAYYDLELTDGSSNVTRVLQGRVQLNKQVTLDAD